MRRIENLSVNWCQALLWFAVLSLTGCISYEPARLVPNVTLSPEDIELPSPSGQAASGVDFGLTAAVNESDSLFNVEILPGVRIRTVAPRGPADLAGLRAGDIVLRVNGEAVNHPDALAALGAQTANPGPFLFEVRRGTTVLEASVVARPTAQSGAALRELYRSDPLASRAGYRTRLINVAGRGEVTTAEIVDIAPDSPMRQGDFRIGDLILALDGQQVGSAQDLIDRFIAAHDPGDRVTLTLYRDATVIDRELRLWDPGRRISRISLRPLMFYESSVAEQQTRFSLLDFWIFSVYRFNRSEVERSHELFEIFGFSSDVGELVEEPR